jgi:hypothetical protein
MPSINEEDENRSGEDRLANKEKNKSIGFVTTNRIIMRL